MVAIIITVIGMFVVPLLFITSTRDGIAQSTVYSITTEFTEGMREQGKLTQEMYLDFIRQLDATGELFDVEIVHKHTTVVPVFGNDNEVIRTEAVDEFYYTDEILKSVYVDGGIYKMQKGDYVTVTVTNRVPTMGQELRNSVYKIYDSSDVIYARYGGIIRDENY